MRVWRKLRGGHWELWYVDSPVNGYVWHRVPVCYLVSGKKPNALCRSLRISVCEQHRPVVAGQGGKGQQP